MKYTFSIDELALLGPMFREALKNPGLTDEFRRVFKRLGFKFDVRAKFVDLSPTQVRMVREVVTRMLVSIKVLREEHELLLLQGLSGEEHRAVRDMLKVVYEKQKLLGQVKRRVKE